MHLFGKDLEREVAVVAEIGVNHEGDVDAAARLIDLAADAGADAVKLQSYTPERYASASDPQRLERVARFSLDAEAQSGLARHASARGIPLFSSALTEDLIPFLAEWCPVIKIASGDLTFELAIRAAARTGKPLILSTGGGSVEEVDEAIRWVESEIGVPAMRERLVLMHCVSAYPTPVEQANLLSIPFLKQRYGLVTGYSNHVIGLEAVLAAVALGAQVVEVHVTDRREGREFRDHALSLEPSELKALVGAVARVRSSLGSFGKDVQECERSVREAIRKGIVAARDLPEGAVLDPDCLMYARPATQIRASELKSVVGKRLARALRKGELITWTDIR